MFSRVAFVLFVVFWVAGCGSDLPDTNVTLPSSSAGACDLSGKNKCLAGALKDIEDNETHIQWACMGGAGGYSDFCQLPQPVAGVCNQVVPHVCSAGAYQIMADTSNTYHWIS